MKRFRSLLCIFPALLLLTWAAPASADKICLRVALNRGKVQTTRRVVSSSASCPRRFIQVVDTAVLTGPPGANGKLQIYGDASAGDLSITSNTDWLLSPPAGNNFQFDTCTIGAGVTLNVPSGAVIRCLTSFTNDGTITVAGGVRGASTRSAAGTSGSSTILDYAISSARSGGLAVSNAQNGARGDDSQNRIGGSGGLGYFNLGSVLGSEAGIQRLYWGIQGGAGGGSASLDISGGGAGGGTLTVLSAGAIVNSATGTISANGGTGSVGGGGGGGGIVTLASPVSIVNAGTVSVTGGTGGIALDSLSAAKGNGGGGGGGLVHFVSPSITPGTPVVTGGAGGSASTALNSVIRSGGGGGGACAGTGGPGGLVNAGAANSPVASSGQDGKVIQTLIDPTTLG